MTTFCPTDSQTKTQSYPSNLVTKETTVQSVSQPTYGAVLRRSHQPEYLAALQVYRRLDWGYICDRSWKLEHCRDSAWFVRNNETGHLRVASSSCKLRWCPVCARARQTYIAHEVEDWLDGSDHPKFLTFTLKHSQAPLEHQVTHLYKFFRELRRRKEFARCIHGGIWFFHIKKSKDDGLWHPHLHCLVTGLYIPKRHLRHLWLQITYDSEIVSIQSVYNHASAAFEAARYAASPGTLADLCEEDRMELVMTMHGRRICGTWGDARKMSLRPQPQYERHKWTNIGTWQSITNDQGIHRNAQAILWAWKNDKPLPDEILYWPDSDYWQRTEDFSHFDVELEKFFDMVRSPP